MLSVFSGPSFSTIFKLSMISFAAPLPCIAARAGVARRTPIRCNASSSRGALPSAARSGGPGHGKLGCSVEFFHAWTEFQMERAEEEFSWNNRNHYWNFDHVIPQNSAKKGIEDPYVVHSWANLRPYPSKKNSSKGCRRDLDEEAKHLETVRDFLARRVFLDARNLVETRGGLLVPDTSAEFDSAISLRSNAKRRRS